MRKMHFLDKKCLYKEEKKFKNFLIRRILLRTFGLLFTNFRTTYYQ